MGIGFIALLNLFSGATGCALPDRLLLPRLSKDPALVSESAHPEIFVVLDLEVGSDGEVSSVKVACSEPKFRSAEVSALKAVEVWKFEGAGSPKNGSVVVRFPSNR